MKVELQSQIKSMILNFGPQHPAAHGVLRLILCLSNEHIIGCDPHIGLLHRGTEYLVSKRPYYLSLPYFDRLDYVSMMLQEHAYCLGIERGMGVRFFNTAILITRTVFDELTRILNHLLAIACHALDVGSMSSIFWAFEERENIMEFYEYVSGARMHAVFYRPISLNRELPLLLVPKINHFNLNFHLTLSEINMALTLNNLWRIRLLGVGKLGLTDIKMFGLTGVMARSLNLCMDLRISQSYTYGYYSMLRFNSFIGNLGDSYTRYLLRIYEMFESTNIITTLLSRYSHLEIKSNKISTLYQDCSSIEGIINGFCLWSGNKKLANFYLDAYIESAKGLFGVTLIGTNSSKPYRCKIRSPSYHNLLFLEYATKNLMLADLITLIGTVDIVFGEIDR